MSKVGDDNRSNQMNPNNDAYYQSRGYGSRSDHLDGDDQGGSAGGGQASHGLPDLRPHVEIHADRVRENIAREMTPAKLGPTLCVFLEREFCRYNFRAIVENDLLIEVTGCEGSIIAGQIESYLRQWLRSRRWMMKYCEWSVELVFL